ncbi:MAG: hypothetical protein RLZZ319_399 [Actinomycetota bacterium]
MDVTTVRRRDLRAAQEKKKRKVLVPFLAGLGVAALFPVVGSTLAANISLGSGDIEFGQGQVGTVTCDTSITITPSASYDAGTDSFNVGNVVLGDIAAACDGKTLTLTAQTSGGDVSIGSHTYSVDADGGTWTFTTSGITSDALTGFILESSS